MSAPSLIPGRPTTRPGSSEWVAAVVLTLAGIVVRALLWHTQRIVSIDGTEYIRLARELAGDPVHAAGQPYGYPFLILVAHWFRPDWILAARAVDFATGVALIPLTWAVARQFVSRPWLRFLPVAAVAFMPLPVHYSLTTMSEAPYVALLLAVVLLVCRRRLLWAGVAAGLACTVRPEALTAAVAVAVVVFFGFPRRHALRFVAAAAVIVAGYLAFQGAHRGVGPGSGKSANFAGSHWWEAEPLVDRDAPPSQVASRLRDRGGAAVGQYPARLVGHGTQVLRQGGWVVPVIALGGLAGPGLLAGAATAQFLVTPIFSTGAHPRFILPYLPFLWILAAVAVDRRRRGWVAAGSALVAAGLVLSAVTEGRAYLANEDGTYPELVDAGNWLAAFVTPTTVVYDRKPYTAFYAGAEYRTIPLEGYDETLDAIIAAGGDFLVLNQQVTRVFRPDLIPLVEDKPVVWHETRLAPVYVDDRYVDGRTIIYRVVRPGGPEPLASENGIKRQLGNIEHSKNHFLHGILAMRAEKWYGAAGEFYYVEQKEPENAAAFNNRAWCLLKANRDLGIAETDARKAVDLEPDNVDYLDTLVEILKTTGEKPRALELWESRLEAARAKRARTAAPTDPPGGD